MVPPLPDEPSVIDVVCHSTARSVAQIIRHDPGARLGGDEEEVHKLRVATRRLRSDLHSFSSLLDETRTDSLRAELRWLGEMIGAVRDTDVLTVRMTTLVASLADTDAVGVNRLMSLLDQESATARTGMMSALREQRYIRLLDALVALAASPPLLKEGKVGRRTSRKVATRIMEKPWRRVVDAVSVLGPDPSDEKLHHVRVLAKRSRYAAEATAPLRTGRRALRLGGGGLANGARRPSGHGARRGVAPPCRGRSTGGRQRRSSADRRRTCTPQHIARRVARRLQRAVIKELP